MSLMESTLIDIGRIGIGVVFLVSIAIDYKERLQIFNLMQQKKVPMPWIFYIGAICWKAITSLGLICNLYTFWAALLLALYIFIANLIFYNFWAVPKEQRGFTLAYFLIHLAACFGLLVISGVAGATIT